MSDGLRALDRRLGLEHPGRRIWIWAVPVVTFLGTLVINVLIGIWSGAGAWLSVPIGALEGAVMAGMSVAYMTPADAHDDDDGGGGGERSPEPPPWPARFLAFRPGSGPQRDEPAPPAAVRDPEREHAGTAPRP